MPRKAKRRNGTQLTASQVERVFKPIGKSGTTIYTGFYNVKDELEYVKEFVGEKAITTLNRMRRSDGQVRLALLALENPIINADWLVREPGDPEQDDLASDQEKEIAAVANEFLFGDRFAFTQTLRDILGFFWAGFSMFEKMYAIEDGQIEVTLESRLQNTIREWFYEGQELSAVRQVVYAGEDQGDFIIPGNKLMCFTFNREGKDVRGISALRAAYKHWYYKDFFYRIQGMQIERWALGIPVIKEGETLTTAGRKAALIEAVENMRAHEQGYLFLPNGYTVEMLDAGSNKVIDPIPAIQHHDASILKTIMAHFLELGMTEVGARSLGETLKNAYLLSLQSWANYVAQQLNKLLTEWTVLNYGESVRPPYLQPTGIQPMDLDLLCGAYQKLGASGFVKKGPKAEAYIRDQLGIPHEDEEWLEEQEKRLPPPFMVQPNENEDDGSDEPDQNDDASNEDKKPEPSEKEPPKQNKRLKAAQGPPMTQVGEEAPTQVEFWRPLRPYERFCQLRAMAGRLDDAREEIVRISRDARKEVTDQLVKQVSDAFLQQNPKAVQDINYNSETAETMTKNVEMVLWDIYQYGENEVPQELRRQKQAKQFAFPGIPEGSATEAAIEAWLKTNASQVSKEALEKLINFAVHTAQTALRTGTFNATEFADEMSEFSENVIRKAGGFVVNEAHNMGRDSAAKKLKDFIKYAEYTAILDNGTCGPCYEMDQKEKRYEVGSPEYEAVTPPLPECEGKSNCRCFWLFVGEETEPEA